MKSTHSPVALTLAFVLTLSTLIGVDHLAQSEAAPSALAQASAPHA